MSKGIKTESVLTPTFTLYFPELAQPNEYGKFRIVAVFDEGDSLDWIKGPMAAAAKELWGDNLPKEMMKSVKTPEDENTPDFYPPNTLHIAIVSKKLPILVDRSQKKTLTPEDFYPGCRCRAVLHCWPYNGKGRDQLPGISFFLDLLQFVDDGERLGGGTAEAKALLAANPLSEAPEISPDDLVNNAFKF